MLRKWRLRTMAAKRSGKGPQGRERVPPRHRRVKGEKGGWGALSHINYFSSHPVTLVHGSECLSFPPLRSLLARSSSPTRRHPLHDCSPFPTPTITRRNQPLSHTHGYAETRQKPISLHGFSRISSPFPPPSLCPTGNRFFTGVSAACRPWRQGTSETIRFYMIFDVACRSRTLLGIDR